jgi:hypothetical protein
MSSGAEQGARRCQNSLGSCTVALPTVNRRCLAVAAPWTARGHRHGVHRHAGRRCPARLDDAMAEDTPVRGREAGGDARARAAGRPAVRTFCLASNQSRGAFPAVLRRVPVARMRPAARSPGKRRIASSVDMICIATACAKRTCKTRLLAQALSKSSDFLMCTQGKS